MTPYEVLENKRKAINERNLIINKVWDDLYSLFSGYDKEILKSDGNFRKNLKTAINEILGKYRSMNIRLYVDCTNYGRIILKVDATYVTNTHTCNYAKKDIYIAMLNDNKIEKMEEIEHLCVFNKNCVILVINELAELKADVEQATIKMNAVKHGPYHEFL